MSTFGLAQLTLALPRIAKRLIVATVDASLCVVAVWFSFYLRLGEFVSLSGPAEITSALAIGIALPVFAVFGLYRAIFRYAGWSALMTVTKATGVYALLFATVVTIVGIQGVPRTLGLIQPMLLLLAVGASRALARFWLGGLYRCRLTSLDFPKS